MIVCKRMRQNLILGGDRTEITGDFLSNRYKKILNDREQLLNEIRRRKKNFFRQKIDNILNKL